MPQLDLTTDSNDRLAERIQELLNELQKRFNARFNGAQEGGVVAISADDILSMLEEMDGSLSDLRESMTADAQLEDPPEEE